MYFVCLHDKWYMTQMDKIAYLPLQLFTNDYSKTNCVGWASQKPVMGLSGWWNQRQERFNAILSVFSCATQGQSRRILAQSNAPTFPPFKGLLLSVAVASHGSGNATALSHPKRSIHRQHQRGGGKWNCGSCSLRRQRCEGNAGDVPDAHVPHPLGPALQRTLSVVNIFFCNLVTYYI